MFHVNEYLVLREGKKRTSEVSLPFNRNDFAIIQLVPGCYSNYLVKNWQHQLAVSSSSLARISPFVLGWTGRRSARQKLLPIQSGRPPFYGIIFYCSGFSTSRSVFWSNQMKWKYSSPLWSMNTEATVTKLHPFLKWLCQIQNYLVTVAVLLQPI